MALTRRLVRPSLLSLALLAGCDVEAPAPPTGGVSLEAGPCGRGLVVIGSDYVSTNVALTDLAGAVRSASLVSSGAAAAGLSTPLSGDVVAPSERPPSGDVVLLDRYPNGVLSWLDPQTGAVRRQLSVATGFPSNPQDYLEVAPGKAYVTRLSAAPRPGSEPFDGGSDVLVIDPTRPAIVGRIAFDAQPPFLPRPSRMARVGGSVWVSLLRLDADFKQAQSSLLVALDPSTDQPRWSLELSGLTNCAALASSPSSLVALSCSGVFAAGPAEQLARSGVVVLDASSEPPSELLRLSGGDLGAPPSSSLAFADENRLLVPLYGDLDSGRPDRLVELSIPSRSVRTVLQSKGAFVLGDVRCLAGCAARCFAADGEAPGLHVLDVSPEGVAASSLVAVAPERGVPPRNLGGF